MSIRLSAWLVTLSFVVVTTPAKAALVAWWNLNDGSGTTAVDGSATPVGGSANDGTLANFTGSFWNTNLAGSTDSVTMPHGLYFAGGPNGAAGAAPASPLVNLSDHVNDFLTLGAGTLSVWYRADITATNGVFTYMTIGNGPVGGYNRFIIQESTSEFVNTNHTGAAFINTTAPYAEDGNWHNLMYTSDGAVSQFYVDGVAVGSASTGTFLNFDPGAPGDPFLSMMIGASQRDLAAGVQTLWYMQGTLGDFRIYDNVLGAAERTYVANAANYGNGLVPEPSAFVLAGFGVIGLGWAALRGARSGKPTSQPRRGAAWRQCQNRKVCS